MGLAIILLTVVVRALLVPFSLRLTRQQKLMADIQKEVEEIKQRYKDNKAEIARKTLELYREKKIKPLSQFWILGLQIVIFIALFSVFNKGIKDNGSALQGLYAFISRPASFETGFLGIFDLSKKSAFFAILVGISQFLQARLSSVKGGAGNEFSRVLQKQTLYVFPLVTFFISLSLPSGILLYWVVSNIITIIQDVLWKKQK